MAGKPEIASQVLLSALNEVATPKSVTSLQTAAFLSILDGVDRKIKRDKLSDLAQLCFLLYGSVGRLRMAISIRDHFDKGTLTKDMLEEAVKGITHDSEDYRNKLREIISVQVQCPVEDVDKVQ